MRRTELDLCRIAGCLMVLVIHAGAEIYQRIQLYTFDFVVVNFLSTMVRGGVPIFFMLTGALILSRSSMDVKKLLKNHALYLLGIFCLWSFIYAALNRIVSGDFGTLYDFVLSFVNGHYHMWFLTAMAMIYLYMPVVHAALYGWKLDGRYFLGLFFVLIMLLANMNLTPDTAPILYGITLHFKLDYLAYMGYVIWGWWLSTKEMPKKALWLAPLIFLVCSLISSYGNYWYSNYKSVAEGWLFSYFSLSSFIQATSVFCFFLALKGREFRHRNIIRALADCTLGVYLIHPLMINVLELVGLGTRPSAPVSSLVLLCVVLAVSCFALVFAAKRIPLVKKLL